MSRLWCRVFGHRYGEGHEEYGFYQWGECLRCGAEICPAEDPSPLWLAFKGRMAFRFARLAKPFRPCPDCGRRFTACPDDVAHLPF